MDQYIGFYVFSLMIHSFALYKGLEFMITKSACYRVKLVSLIGIFSSVLFLLMSSIYFFKGHYLSMCLLENFGWLVFDWSNGLFLLLYFLLLEHGEFKRKAD